MATRSAKDACDLLDADHRNVKKMFKEYEELTESRGRNSSQKKMELARQICMELTLHTQVEEEIFYPAAREAIEEQDLLDEAEVEHASAKELISQLQSMQPSDELYDAKVTVLGEYVEHHVKEEEKEMFPKVRKARLDLELLAEQIEERKQQAVQ